MRKFIYAAAALALAECSSYSEIARWNSDVLTNDGERPVASFVTQNFSYQLLGVIPLCTGLPWTEGDEDVMDDFNVRFLRMRRRLTATWFRLGTRSSVSAGLIASRNCTRRSTTILSGVCL